VSDLFEEVAVGVSRAGGPRDNVWEAVGWGIVREGAGDRKVGREAGMRN